MISAYSAIIEMTPAAIRYCIRLHPLVIFAYKLPSFVPQISDGAVTRFASFGIFHAKIVQLIAR